MAFLDVAVQQQQTPGSVAYSDLAALEVRVYPATDNTLRFVDHLGVERVINVAGIAGIVTPGLTSTATAAGTTTLTKTSSTIQVFTGVTTQNCVLPDATTLVAGWWFTIRNTSTGIVTVKDGGAGATVIALAANQEVTLYCSNVGSAAGAWSQQSVTGTGKVVLASAPTLTSPVISGGTIDNTPVGTTTRQLGYFSALREYIGGFAAIFTHANSADRTYTFPDFNGTMATLAGTETLTNKTIVGANNTISLTGKQTLAGNAATGTIGIGGTAYMRFSGALTGTENLAAFIVPVACTVTRLYLTTGTAQPASGALTITLRKNAVAQAITFVIAAGTAAGDFSDLAHSVSFAAGDKLSLEGVNAATAVSAQLAAYSLELDTTVS